MKQNSLYFLTCAALVLGPALRAQDAPPADRHPGAPPPHDTRSMPGANLTQEEREKLRAAHEKAMQDPGLQAARDKFRQSEREFRQAQEAALLAADPSLDPILKKLRTAREQAKPAPHKGAPEPQSR